MSIAQHRLPFQPLEGVHGREEQVPLPLRRSPVRHEQSVSGYTRPPGYERVLQPPGREHGDVVRPHPGFYQLRDECFQKPDRLFPLVVVVEYGVRPVRRAHHGQLDARDDGSLDRHLARVTAVLEQILERRRAVLQAVGHSRLHVFPVDVLPRIEEQVPVAAAHAVPQQQVEHVQVFGSQEILGLVDDEHIPARPATSRTTPPRPVREIPWRRTPARPHPWRGAGGAARHPRSGRGRARGRDTPAPTLRAHVVAVQPARGQQATG